MIFVSNLKNSFYNPVFYRSLKDKSLGFSMKYFFSFIVILAFIVAFILGSELAPLFSAESLKKFVSFYPKELSLTIKNGVVSSNVSEPYVLKATSVKKGEHSNYLVVDTSSDSSLDTFRKYDTDVLIGRNFIVSEKGKSQIQVTDISRLPDFTFNQELLFHWADVIGSHHLALSFGFFFILWTAFVFYFTFNLVWLAVMALIVLLIGKVKAVSLSYSQSLKITLFASTLPLILKSIFVVAAISAPFPLFFSVLIVVVVIANIKADEIEISHNPSEVA
ncbi:MAG: DUF1189 domain-containing protein [Candidatus Taylorbacteria bacterium]|nr:DUF1189 domain-containing protein [Candidatus Taylorbacteria bacterium]